MEVAFVKRGEKEELVSKLRAELSNCPAAILIEYKGMTAGSIFQLRKALREKGARMQVVKNTLLSRAVEGTRNSALSSLVGGPVAVTHTGTDPAALAKEVAGFAKKDGKLVIRGGVLDGRIIDAKVVEELATLPPLVDMRANLLGLMSAPPRNLLSVLLAVPRRFLGVLKARAEQGTEENNN